MSGEANATSDLPLKADIRRTSREVRKVLGTDSPGLEPRTRPLTSATLPRNTEISRSGLGTHQTQELGFVDLPNIEEAFGYPDDPVPVLQQQFTGASVTGCEIRLDFVRC